MHNFIQNLVHFRAYKVPLRILCSYHMAHISWNHFDFTCKIEFESNTSELRFAPKTSLKWFGWKQSTTGIRLFQIVGQTSSSWNFQNLETLADFHLKIIQRALS